MDKIFARLFTSKLGISSDAVVVYLILRSDVCLESTAASKLYKKSKGKFVSGLSIQAIADRISLPLLTVNRLILELIRNGWVVKLPGDLYELGYVKNFELKDYEKTEVIWYSHKEIEDEDELKRSKVSAVIRKMLDESKERRESAKKVKVKLTFEAKRLSAESKGIVSIIGDGLVRETTDASKLLRWFKDYCYEAHKIKVDIYKEEGESGKESAGLVYPKIYAKLKRVIVWCDSDVDRAGEYMKWAIDNWEKVKVCLEVMGDPSISLLCTKSVFLRLSRWMVTGFPVEKRYKKDRDGMASRGSKEEHELDDEGL